MPARSRTRPAPRSFAVTALVLATVLLLAAAPSTPASVGVGVDDVIPPVGDERPPLDETVPDVDERLPGDEIPPDEQPGGLCDDHPPGTTPVVRGCAAVQVVANPDLVLAEPAEALARIEGALAGQVSLEPVATAVAPARASLVRTGQQLRAGEICAAVRSHGSVARHLSTARDRLDRLVREAVREAQGADASGDVRQVDLRLAGLRAVQTIVETESPSASSAGPELEPLCPDSAVEEEVRGRVETVDHEAGLIHLDDGTVFNVPPETDGAISAGLPVTVTGFPLGDASMAATGLTGVDVVPDSVVACRALRIAPVQPSAPNGAWTLHDPRGYERPGGALQLEQLMRLAAVSTGDCPLQKEGAKVVRYRTSILVDGPGDADFAAIDVGPTPIVIPPFQQVTGEYTVAVRTYRVTCLPLPTGDVCDLPVMAHDRVWHAEVRPVTAYASVHFDEHVFTVESGPDGSWESTSLAGRKWRTDEVVTLVGHAAEGHAVTGGLAASTPGPIGPFEEFAVFAEDPFHEPGALLTVHQMTASGQDRPSGIRWAHVVGHRGGHPFRYSAALPPIVRDAVSRCPAEPGFVVPQGDVVQPEVDEDGDGDPDRYPPMHGPWAVPDSGDAFYTLPFDSGASVALGRVHIHDPQQDRRHPNWQAYAADLAVGAGQPIRAARGGVVVAVEESDPYNYEDVRRPADWDKFGNYVTVRHQDGSFATYYHLQHLSVPYEVGDAVERGDMLGREGDTGFASGSHVHVDMHDAFVRDDPSAALLPVWRLRVAQGFGPSQLDPCHVIRAGEVLIAT